MCKVDIKNGDTRIDPCMRELVKSLNNLGIETIMCCCGHGKYNPTMIVKTNFNGLPLKEIFSGFTFSSLKKRFYKRDKKGYYYIPEVSKEKL